MNIFLFHRDLRVEDNTGLKALFEKSSTIALVFIFNEENISKNSYFSHPAFNFMQVALASLAKQVDINIFKGSDEIEVFNEIKKKYSITRIYTNKDFTPFAIKRDLKLQKWCQNNQIEFKNDFNDYLLIEPNKMLNSYGGCHKVFRSFFEKLKSQISFLKKPISPISFTTQKITLNQNFHYQLKIKNTIFPHTKKNVFQAISKQTNYQFDRNRLDLDNTSKIGAAIKFGIVSIRQAFWKACKLLESDSTQAFIRQMVWREFFYHHFIYSYKYGHDLSQNILAKYKNWVWNTNAQDPKFIEWCNGQTGVPLVDAAMRQLNQSGFMHNRARMIVACYLTKSLNFDWRLGEKYFAQKLVDYDPIVNNQSWQWVAGTGLDFRGEWRVFNPYTQAQKFDHFGSYTNKYGQTIDKNIDIKALNQKFKLRREKYLK